MQVHKIQSPSCRGIKHCSYSVKNKLPNSTRLKWNPYGIKNKITNLREHVVVVVVVGKRLLNKKALAGSEGQL